MESNEYRLEQWSGEIYTEEEYKKMYNDRIPTSVYDLWHEMKVVPLDGLPLEEVKKKMKYIYCQLPKVFPGDIIMGEDRRHAYVESIQDGKMIVYFMNGGGCEEFKGPYWKLASAMPMNSI